MEHTEGEKKGREGGVITKGAKGPPAARGRAAHNIG